MRLHNICAEALRLYPDKIAIQSAAGAVSYRQLHDRADRRPAIGSRKDSKPATALPFGFQLSGSDHRVSIVFPRGANRRGPRPSIPARGSCLLHAMLRGGRARHPGGAMECLPDRISCWLIMDPSFFKSLTKAEAQKVLENFLREDALLRAVASEGTILRSP